MRRNEDGAAAVEFALVLPVLILLVFGIIEFGFVFNRWLGVTHAAREGVRSLSLGDPDAETDAEASAPDLGSPIDCTASYPAVDQVQMSCTTPYDLQMVIFTAPLDVTSTARMRKE